VREKEEMWSGEEMGDIERQGEGQIE